MRRLPPLLCLLALLAASSHAAAVTGHLSAASIEAAGNSSTTADLAGLFVRHTTTPDFTLNADRLTIEHHHANATLRMESRYNVVGKPDTIHDGPGLLTGKASRALSILWVLPLKGHDPPTLTASVADCTTLDPPAKGSITTRAQVNTVEPEWSIDTSKASGAAAWRTCTDAAATITGDFLFVLWERDATLTANGEAQTLRTGHQDFHPGTPLDGTVGTADELFITVQGGTLTLPLAPGAHELYLRAPRVDAASWRFTNATGTLPVVGDVDGTVRVAGHLTSTVAGGGAGAPLAVDVEGRPLAINGEPVATMVPAPQGTLWIFATAWLAVAVLTAAVAWMFLHRRHAGGEAGVDASGPVAGQSLARVQEGRDVEAERRVLRMVVAAPGLTVREVQQRVRVSKERSAAALEALLERGAVARRGSPSRWHIFPPWPDLDERWRREAALRQEKLRLLLGILQSAPGGVGQPELVALCRERWEWSPNTTKRRLRALAEAGLAKASKSVPPSKSVPRGTVFDTWRPA